MNNYVGMTIRLKKNRDRMSIIKKTYFSHYQPTYIKCY